MKTKVSKVVTAQNTTSDPVVVRAGTTVAFGVSGTLTATVTPQISPFGDEVFYDFGSDMTAVGYQAVAVPVDAAVRVTCKTSEYTAGTFTMQVAAEV